MKWESKTLQGYVTSSGEPTNTRTATHTMRQNKLFSSSFYPLFFSSVTPYLFLIYYL